MSVSGSATTHTDVRIVRVRGRKVTLEVGGEQKTLREGDKLVVSGTINVSGVGNSYGNLTGPSS